MLKKTIFFVSLIILLGFQKMYAIENIPQKPEIIPRESWGANELYTDIESSYWQAILERRKKSICMKNVPKCPETFQIMSHIFSQK